MTEMDLELDRRVVPYGVMSDWCARCAWGSANGVRVLQGGDGGMADRCSYGNIQYRFLILRGGRIVDVVFFFYFCHKGWERVVTGGIGQTLHRLKQAGIRLGSV